MALDTALQPASEILPCWSCGLRAIDESCFQVGGEEDWLWIAVEPYRRKVSYSVALIGLTEASACFVTADKVVVERVEAHPGFHMVQRTSKLAAWEIVVETLDPILEASDHSLHVDLGRHCTLQA